MAERIDALTVNPPVVVVTEPKVAVSAAVEFNNK
jgi:hypothetical protein